MWNRHLLLSLLLPLLTALPAAAQGTEYPAVKYRSNYLASYYLSHSSTTTPWWPAWSPDGKWIAVSLYGSIWKVDAHTGEAFELTHDRKLHSSPAWSPDGQWIVYTADDNWRSIQLEILNVATGATRALTHDDQVYVDPAFSPDGSKLVYVSTRSNGNLHIFVRPIHNGDWSGSEVALTRDHSFGHARSYFSEWDIHIEPAWLKNGQELLLVSNRNVPLGSGDLWRVPVAPDAMAAGRPILQEQSLYRTRPDVAPDGKRLVYSSSGGAADQFNHLYVLPISGGHPYKLTFGDFDDFHPRWSPDGESIAFLSNQRGLLELYVLEVNGGGRRRLDLRQRHWKNPVAGLRVTVLDSESGRPIPARISGEASDGKLYAPSTAYVFNARLATGLKRVFYTAGSYTVEIPPSRTVIEATKGFEYEPARAEIDAKAGETAEVTLRLRHRVDLSRMGWYNGSTHVHMNYGGNLHNRPEDLMLIARAQGMHIISSLVANKDNRVFDWQYFTPGNHPHPASNPAEKLLLLFGEENRPPFWGHTFYIGLRDHLISPFVTGYEGTAIDSLYPSNTDLFRKAREQGAATGYVHAFGGESDPLAGGLGGAKAFAVDVALGTVDALEWSAASRGSLIPLHHAWNNDFPITPVGGEDSLANMQDNRPIGIIRTFAYLGKEFSVPAWVDAIRKGHTFLSSGPVVQFSVNGKIPGERIDLPASGGEVSIEGSVWSNTPIRKILVHQSGIPLWEIPAGADPHHAVFSKKIHVTASSWFGLVVEADELPPAPPQAYSQAITNCVRVYTGSQKIRNAESARYFLQWIEKLRGQISSPSLWRTPAEHQHVEAQLNEAARVYQARLQEAGR